jgi:hypothetical protein
MKTTKSVLASVLTLCFVIVLSGTASARGRVYVGIGVGFPAYGHYCGGYRGYYGHPNLRHYHPYYSTVIVGSGYWCDWGPGCCIAEPRPRAAEKEAAVVQPSVIDNDTQELFKKLRNKKNELLGKIQSKDKQQRKEAVNDLAGFSFDDKVRAALEKVLLSDVDPELRKAAAEAFGKVKNAKALPVLQKARVEDSSEEVRKAADNAIKNTG